MRSSPSSRRAANVATGSTSSIEHLPSWPARFRPRRAFLVWGSGTGNKGSPIYLHILRWPAETDSRCRRSPRRIVRHSVVTGNAAVKLRQSESAVESGFGTGATPLGGRGSEDRI